MGNQERMLQRESLEGLSIRALLTKIENLTAEGARLFDQMHEHQHLKSPEELETLNNSYAEKEKEKEACIFEIERRTTR